MRFSTEVNVRLFCSYGTLEELNLYGLNTNSTRCPKDQFSDLTLDS